MAPSFGDSKQNVLVTMLIRNGLWAANWVVQGAQEEHWDLDVFQAVGAG
jgi:hypothetical protein